MHPLKFLHTHVKNGDKCLKSHRRTLVESWGSVEHSMKTRTPWAAGKDAMHWEDRWSQLSGEVKTVKCLKATGRPTSPSLSLEGLGLVTLNYFLTCLTKQLAIMLDSKMC